MRALHTFLRSHAGRYAVAIAAVALGTWARLLLQDAVGNRVPFITFFLVVVVAAWYGGLGPALLAVALCALAAAHWFIPPGDSLLPSVAADWMSLVTFVATGAAIAVIGQQMRSARLRAEEISEQRGRQQERLSESEALKTSIVETAHDSAVVMDHHGNIVEFNAAAEQTFGYARTQVLGRPMAKFLVPERYRRQHSEGLARYLATGEAAVLGKRLELPVLRADGSEFPAELVITRTPAPGPPLFTAWLRDISEQKRMEQLRNVRLAVTQLLNESRSVEETVRGILQAVCESLQWRTGAVWTVDHEAQVLRCRDLWRRPDDSLRPFELATRERVFQPGIGLPGRVWTSSEPAWISDVVHDPNFPRAPLAEQCGLHSAIGCPVHVDGKFFGVFEFFSEHIHQPDDELVETIAAIGDQVGQFIERRRAEEALHRNDRRKNEFLAMLGHELRNPLAPIRSGLDVLALESKGGNETVALMQEQLDHLVRLVDDLLDVSRIISGKIELRKETVDLRTIVKRAVAAVAPLVEAEEQALDVFLPDDPVWLDADPVRLVQVVENLLNNASKYSDSGAQIELATRCEDGRAVISVRDNGMGIDPQVLPQIFDWYVQASRSYHRAQGGLGLGLTLVQNLVEMHGGKVTAHSEGPGYGSEFVVRLPVSAVQPDTDRGADQPKEFAPSKLRGPVEGRRIMIVDDNAGAAAMLSLLLRRLGPHDVAVLHDGPSALAAAPAFQPDLVLLDIGMPGMSGHEVARVLRQTPEGENALLVALTGYGQEEDRRRSHEAGFDEHLVKPPSQEHLLRLLDHAKLNGRRSRIRRSPEPTSLPATTLAISRSSVTSVERRAGGYLRELAHDVGNALHPIHLIVQVLGQPNLDAAMIQRLRKGLESQAPSLERLVSDLRRVSLIARDAVEPHPQMIDPATLLRTAAEQLRPTLEESGMSLDVQVPDALPRLCADPGLLEKMIEELLENAARHTPPGGHILLSANDADGEVVVCVADNGEGISPELLPHVFDLFVRGDEDSLCPGRFGVGLTFVRQVAQKHGGRVTAESGGPGAKFTVHLPKPRFDSRNQ